MFTCDFVILHSGLSIIVGEKVPFRLYFVHHLEDFGESVQGIGRSLRYPFPVPVPVFLSTARNAANSLRQVSHYAHVFGSQCQVDVRSCRCFSASAFVIFHPPLKCVVARRAGQPKDESILVLIRHRHGDVAKGS